jgi:hypothetical protein
MPERLVRLLVAADEDVEEGQGRLGLGTAGMCWWW